MSDKKAVRQDLVNTVGKNLDQQQGIQEFECSLSESSDTESKDTIKEKKKASISKRTLALILRANVAVNPGAPRNKLMNKIAG